MASRVYHETLLKKILSELLVGNIESNPTVDIVSLDRKVTLLNKQIQTLIPKEYNRRGKITSMLDGLFLKLNVTDKADFIDKDIKITLNGVITLLQDGDVTKYYDIYTEMIIPQTFITQQGRKTPVIITSTEDTFLLFRAFITRIVTYNGEYYIQIQFPHITQAIDEAQDIDVCVYIENDQLTIDMPEDPSAVAIESTCKEIPFGSTPNHDPILNADQIVRSDIVRYLTITDTDHYMEDLTQTDPQHLIFRKENYPTDPTLPPEQQPIPDMVSLSIKYNDSIIWVQDYSIGSMVNEGDIDISPLEGYLLEGLYDKPLTDDTKQRIEYPVTLNESKVYYANYVLINNVRSMKTRLKGDESDVIIDNSYECNTRDEFIQKLEHISNLNNGDLKSYSFILNFISDLSNIFKNKSFQSFPKIIINSDYLDCSNMCENLILKDSTNFKDFINQIQSLDNVIYQDTFKNIQLLDDKVYEGILKNPIRITLKNKYDLLVKTFLYDRTQILNLCSYIQYEKYEGVYLDIAMSQEITGPLTLSKHHPDELVFYVKEYTNPVYFIKTAEDLVILQNNLLDVDYPIENQHLVFSPEFNTSFSLNTYKLPKTVYFMINKTLEKPVHLIEWCLLKGGVYHFDTYFNRIYDITYLGKFIKCIDQTIAELDFMNAPVQNITTLEQTFGINIKLNSSLSIFHNLKTIINLFRYPQSESILNQTKIECISGLYYNIYDESKEVVVYPSVNIPNNNTNNILYRINAFTDDHISKFKLIDYNHIDLQGYLIDIYKLIDKETLTNTEFIWNKQKILFTFKALNLNFNVNGYLEVEFEKELSIYEFIQLVYLREIKIPEISESVMFLSTNISDNNIKTTINRMLTERIIVCKK